MAKRVLWLYNHSTLMKSEVPILRELGYEVFIPKIPPFDVSIAVDWESDKLLTISKEEIDILNGTDFYNTKIPAAAMEVMNTQFDMAIFGVFIEPLKSLVCAYNGILMFHPFGVQNDSTYTKIIELLAGSWLLKKIEKLGNRFWFAQSYENLAEIECEFFKNRAIHFPIGMKNTDIVDRWTGEKHKLLFVCPRIKMNRYYENLYKWFVKEFWDIPYSIGGAQPISVEEDKNVLGFLEQKEFDNLFPSHSVMFYHSEEKRHIHYHPFEAIKCGLPVIYMAGGLMDQLGGKDLPGRCKTLKEAKKKCKRIIDGDRKFADKIRMSQVVLLKKMSYDFCMGEWKKAIKVVTETKCGLQVNQKKKIAFVLPLAYMGGVLDYTERLVRAFQTTIRRHEYDIELVLGYLKKDDSLYMSSLKRLETVGVVLREFQWETIDFDRVKRAEALTGNAIFYAEKEYCIMNDGMQYFGDCNYVLFMADRLPGMLYLQQPYAVIVHDYIQRYVPKLFGAYYEKYIINAVRNSDMNFATSNTIIKDCIQYAGIPANKITRLPRFFDNITENDFSSKAITKKNNERYFLWSTNLTPHKNHIVALHALDLYYANGGSIKCYVTGHGVKALNDKKSLAAYQKYLESAGDASGAYVSNLFSMVEERKNIRKNVKFMGNLIKNEYYNLLKNAEFLFHPGYGDNGNGSSFEGALFSVPTVSSDYPAMREMNEELNMGMTFFDREDEEKIADKLWDIEKNGISDNCMASREELIKFTVSDDYLCERIYQLIMSAISI